MKKHQVLLTVMALGLSAAMSINAADLNRGQVSGEKTSEETEVVPTAKAEIEWLEDDRGFYTARQRMMEIWSEYLAVMDELCDTQEWTYEAVEAFLENEDWESLEEARRACAATLQDLNGMEERAGSLEDLSEEDYDILYDRGIDISYQSMILASCRAYVQETGTLLRRAYQAGLESYLAYSGAEREEMKDMLVISREKSRMQARYDCLTTNYLLLSLGEDEVTRDFWDAMSEKFSSLCKDKDEWIGSETDLLSDSQKLEDEMLELTSGVYRILASRKAAMDEAEEFADAKDGAFFLEQYEGLPGSPALLPAPDWYKPFQAEFFYIQKMEGSCAAVRVEDVTREEVSRYVEGVTKYALQTEENPEEGTWQIDMGDYQVLFSQEDTAVTVCFEGADNTFAPAGII